MAVVTGKPGPQEQRRGYGVQPQAPLVQPQAPNMGAVSPAPVGGSTPQMQQPQMPDFSGMAQDVLRGSQAKARQEEAHRQALEQQDRAAALERKNLEYASKARQIEARDANAWVAVQTLYDRKLEAANRAVENAVALEIPLYIDQQVKAGKPYDPEFVKSMVDTAVRGAVPDPLTEYQMLQSLSARMGLTGAEDTVQGAQVRKSLEAARAKAEQYAALKERVSGQGAPGTSGVMGPPDEPSRKKLEDMPLHELGANIDTMAVARAATMMYAKAKDASDIERNNNIMASIQRRLVLETNQAEQLGEAMLGTTLGLNAATKTAVLQGEAPPTGGPLSVAMRDLGTKIVGAVLANNAQGVIDATVGPNAFASPEAQAQRLKTVGGLTRGLVSQVFAGSQLRPEVLEQVLNAAEGKPFQLSARDAAAVAPVLETLGLAANRWSMPLMNDPALSEGSAAIKKGGVFSDTSDARSAAHSLWGGVGGRLLAASQLLQTKKAQQAQLASRLNDFMDSIAGLGPQFSQQDVEDLRNMAYGALQGMVSGISITPQDLRDFSMTPPTTRGPTSTLGPMPELPNLQGMGRALGAGALNAGKELGGAVLSDVNNVAVKTLGGNIDAETRPPVLPDWMKEPP